MIPVAAVIVFAFLAPSAAGAGPRFPTTVHEFLSAPPRIYEKGPSRSLERGFRGSLGGPGRVSRSLAEFAFRPVLMQDRGISTLDDADEGLPVDAESRLLERGHRNPWMAGLASLLLPGAGQFYNAVTPYAFTMRGFRMWMYTQGGAHALILATSIFCQFVGTRVEMAGGSEAFRITEKIAQQWRVVHVVNMILASVSAFLEARLINRAGERYVVGMRMHAYYDPSEGSLGVEVGLSF
jgi:hypothetical protein